MKIGQKVTRVNSGRDSGQTGTVCEISGERARIVWDKGGPRTWINFKFLQ